LGDPDFVFVPWMRGYTGAPDARFGEGQSLGPLARFKKDQGEKR